MGKPLSKTAVGAFVLGAIALIIIAVAVLGSGVYFKRSQVYVTFFQGSVNELNVGAPVLFRGVQIGTVKNISLRFSASALEFYIPVVFEIIPDQVKSLGPPPEKEDQEVLHALILKGLRAQLTLRSVITGQLAVSLDFFPGRPARYVGLEKKYPEIPSVPSDIEEFTKTLQGLPIKDLIVKIDSAVSGIDAFINSSSTQASVKSLEKMIREATAVLKTVNSRLNPLLDSLQGTSEEIRMTLSKIDRSMSGDKGVLEASRKTVIQAEETLNAIKQIAQENSAMGQDLGSAVEEMSRALRSFRSLAETLDRHPESILRGKK